MPHGYASVQDNLEERLIRAEFAILTERVRCNFCTRSFHAQEIHRIGGAGGQRICPACTERHLATLQALATGEPPKGCMECNTAFELIPCDAAGNTRLSLIVKDGIQQLLCQRCADAYVPKRRDLFAGTAFAHEKGLSI